MSNLCTYVYTYVDTYLLSALLINTSVLLLLRIVTPQVVTDTIVKLNFSLHSSTMLSVILIVNECIVALAGTLTVTYWLPL